MNKQHENSLTFFKLLTNNSFDIISLLNAGGTIVFESNSTERMLGYASGERNGLKAFDFVHPDDRQLVIRVFNELLEEPEGHRSAEFRYQHKNGKWIWLESNAQNFINRPDINGIVINSRDITKKKQEEQKLIETVELNKSIVNSTQDCFKTLDLEGNLLSMNKNGQELMEIDSVASCLNLSWLNFWKGEDYKNAKKAIEKAKNGEIGHFEGYCPTLKGTPKWWSVIVSPVHDKSGRINQLLSVSRDITLQKDREIKLQERIKELNCIKELSDLVEKNETIEGILNGLAPVIQKSFLHPEKTNVRITLNRKTFMTHNFMETNHVLSSEIHKYNKTVGKIEVFYFTKEALNEAPFLEEEKNLLEILVKRLGYLIERQEDEKKWKEIFNSTSEAIIIHDDKTGKMVDCNDVTVDMYGYESKEEMVSRDVNDFSSTRIQYNQDEIIRHLKKAVTEGSHTFEWLAKKKSGEEFWVEVSLKRTTIGGEGMLLSVVRDIADRKQAELSLQESWQNLKQAQQIARLGNWELDHRIDKLTWSDEIFRIFNCEPQEFKATYEAFLEFVHPDDREKVDTAFKKSLQTKQPYEIIHRLLLEDGSIKHVKEKCDTIFDQRGKPINSKGIVLDITEIKEKESKLQQYSVKLEELNATKDKFFSIVSHDLKNPFNAIMGFAALAIEKLKNKEYEKVGRYCELIYQNTKHSDNLLKNLLQWSRLQREKTDFTAEQLNLQHIVNNIAGLHKANYQEKNIQLHIDIPGNLFVNTDSFMLETTIRNLLSNAIKYTHKGGRVEILAVQENDKTRISVKDNGVGIKQEHKGKLFRIESSYSTPGTGNEKGTGLGLILCKEFVEKLGGNIWVESQEGKGTTFHFTVKNEI